MSIEAYNPAEITFPDPVKTVLIVNNAVPQPPESGYEYSFKGVAQDTCKASADSALFAACRSLGKAIAEKDYFEDVLLYHDPVRTDDVYYSDKRLTQAQVRSLCRENEADAIISLDLLLFHMKKDVVLLGDGYALGNIDVVMKGVVRTYLPDRENPLATVLVNDSIFWAETGDLHTLQNRLLPTPEEALIGGGEYIGEKILPNFVPHWRTDVRWYFNGASTIWKEASAFAAGDKWDRAFERWNTIHQRSRGWKDKAKTASNIALYYEVQEKLQEAYEWSQQSYELFLKHQGEEDAQTKRQKAYMDALQSRLLADAKLEHQLSPLNSPGGGAF